MTSRLKRPVAPQTLLTLCWLVVGLGASDASFADVRRTPADTASDRIIVKWRETGVAAIQLESLSARTSRLRDVSGLPLRGVRSLNSRLDVVRLRGAADESTVRAAVARLRADPSVQYAEIDARRFIHAIPNDTRYAPGSDLLGDWRGQWYLADPTAATPAAIGATTAWDTTRGTGLRIAVIDTGIVADHPDLAGKLLAGRDFVCHDSATQSCQATGAIQSLVANDGGGWDTDPADPGDWISATDLARSDNFFDGCGQGTNHDEPIDSSWHGTRVAGGSRR
jgi:serine protease